MTTFFSIQQDIRTASSSRVRPTTACIVDPHAGDYHDWRTTADTAGVQVAVVASASEALKIARTQSVDLWLVNSELPGLGGIELCSMLRSRSRNVPIVIAAEEYSPDLERAALGARATLFLCKPTHREWLGDWLESQSAPRPSRC